MDNNLKFKLKTFIIYLLVEPWTGKIVAPSIGAIGWILIFSGWIFRSSILFFLGITLITISYLIREYKSGKFIYWYRQRKYKREKKNDKGKVPNVPGVQASDQALN